MASLKSAVFGILFAVLVGYLLNENTSVNSKVNDKQPLDTEYDFIVIGSGSAGSVVAARLTEDKDNKVLFLEAGGHFNEYEAINIPILWTLAQGTKHDWQYYTEPQTESFQGLNDKKGVLPRGRVFGGTSCLNTMQFTRGSPFDFDEWEAAGCEGWGYKDVLSYFRKLEDVNIEELKSSPYRSTGGPIASSLGYDMELNHGFLRAGQELGYEITDYNGEDQHGFSLVQNTIRNGVRSNTALEYIEKAEFKENLHVSLNSLATKIEISENKRATGVYFIKDGKKRFIRCKKEIVVSAGAINSPQLLMLSGIGPKAHLEELGIKVKVDLPVGKNLQDHHILALKSTITKPISMRKNDVNSIPEFLKYKLFGKGPLSSNGLGATAFLHLDKTKQGKTWPDFQLSFFPLLFSDNFVNLRPGIFNDYLDLNVDKYGFTTVISTTRPKSVGSITLRSIDPFDHPKIDTAYFTNKDDLDTMVGGIRVWEKLMETKVFKELGVNIDDAKFKFCSDYKFRSDEYWQCVIKMVSTTNYHHSGTCRMGKRDSPTAVVDSQLKVIGIQGLRVADASIFPNVTSGNINVPTIMIGEKAADMIRHGK